MDDISSKPNLYVFSINNKHTHSSRIVVIVVQPYDFSNKNRIYNLTGTSVIERLKQNVNSHNKQIMETIWWYCDCFLLLNTILNNDFFL